MDSLNILITGASGHLGRELFSFLSHKKNYQIYKVEGKSDFSEAENILKKNKIDFVIHSGFAVDFSEFDPNKISTSVVNTGQLINWAKIYGMPHIIFLSAAGVFGVRYNSQLTNEDSEKISDPPFSSYTNTQYIQDKIVCEKLLDQYTGKLTSYYLTTVYSPKMPTDLINFISMGKALCPLKIVPPGGTSYLDLRDFLLIIEKNFSSKLTGKFILSSGNVTYKQIIQTSIQVYKSIIPKFVISLPAFTFPIIKNIFSLLNKSFTLIGSSFGYKYYSPQKFMLKGNWKYQFSLKQTLKYCLRRED